jgi:hypothetical protein
MVIVAVEPLPHLKIAAVNWQCAKDPLKPKRSVNKELLSVRRPAEMRRKPMDGSTADNVLWQRVHESDGFRFLGAAAPDGFMGAPKDETGNRINVGRGVAELSLREMANHL